MTIHLSKSKILAVGAVAFIAGVFFASSMDWTRILGAQSKVPGRSALTSNAALEDSQNAFVSVAERVTPAVVSVSAERTTKPQDTRNRIRQLPPEFQQSSTIRSSSRAHRRRRGRASSSRRTDTSSRTITWWTAPTR